MVSFEIGGPSGYSEVAAGYELFSDRKRKSHKERTACPECKHEFDILIQLPDIVVDPTESGCTNSDITRNKDIDKYVLNLPGYAPIVRATSPCRAM